MRSMRGRRWLRRRSAMGRFFCVARGVFIALGRGEKTTQNQSKVSRPATVEYDGWTLICEDGPLIHPVIADSKDTTVKEIERMEREVMTIETKKSLPDELDETWRSAIPNEPLDYSSIEFKPYPDELVILKLRSGNYGIGRLDLKVGWRDQLGGYYDVPSHWRTFKKVDSGGPMSLSDMMKAELKIY